MARFKRSKSVKTAGPKRPAKTMTTREGNRTRAKAKAAKPLPAEDRVGGYGIVPFGW